MACFSDLPSAGAGMISSGSIGSLGGVGCWIVGVQWGKECVLWGCVSVRE